MISFWRRRSVRVACFAAAGLALVLSAWVGGLSIRYGLRAKHQGLSVSPLRPVRWAVKEVVDVTLKPYYDYRLARTTDLPIYDFQMRRGQLQEWRGVLQRAMERGRGIPEDNEYLEAWFRGEGEQIEVEVRSRGSMTDHYRLRKPSFRVKFPKDRNFRNSRQINLIIPDDKVGTEELNFVADRYGLLTYDRRYVVARLNGRMLGVYQEIEHFGKEMAVNRSRAEGFFFNAKGEGKSGAEASDHPGAKLAVDALVGCLEGCSAEAADELLDRYIDEEKMATFAALTTLFGASHAWGRDNMMVFFDPNRGRLEPVPWDSLIRPLSELEEGPIESTIWLGNVFLRDASLRSRRNELLWEMLNSQIEAIVEEARSQFERLQRSLNYDVDHSRAYVRRKHNELVNALQTNAKQLREALVNEEVVVVAGVDGLRIENHGLAQVEIDHLTMVDSRGRSQDVEVGGTVPGRFRDELGVRGIETSSTAPITSIVLHGRNAVTGEALQKDDYRLTVVDSSVAPIVDQPSRPRREPPIAEIEAAWADGVPAWRFAGTIEIDQDLVVPAGTAVHLEEGLQLRLGPNVDLIVQGDLISSGTAQRPVVVEAADPNNPFGTFAVVGRAHRPARVMTRHTTVRGGSEGDFMALHLSGAFSVYDGSLFADHLRIEDAAGEDGLNVKHGRVDIRDLTVVGSASDAVDLDFCSGILTSSRISGAGGDGLDFSGSLIEIADNVIVDSGDKGMSIGEGSRVWLDNNTIERAKMGIAIKDRSRALAVGNRLADLEVGTAVYQKKPVFGSGTVEYVAGTIDNVDTSFLIDPEAIVVRPIDS